MSQPPEQPAQPERPARLEPEAVEPAPAVAEGWLPAPAVELFGEGASATDEYALLTVDVPIEGWLSALRLARDELGCTYFDWLSAVDEPGTGFLVCAHLVALPTEEGRETGGDRGALRRLVLRTTVPHEAAELPTATGVFAGASWHERETYEMFGVRFADHPRLEPLLLPDGFEGHPLRKDFVLAARVAKAWPGAKEPGESHDGGPKRRQMLPPGVPDPNEWGPLKGQLPPAPARPARGRAGARRAGAGRAGSAGDEPGRTRGAAASQSAGGGAESAEGTRTPRAPATGESATRPRRARTAAEGSASQQPAEASKPADAAGPTETAGATGSVPETPATSQVREAPTARPRRSRSASEGSASQRTSPSARDDAEAPADAPADAPGQRSADAPWHHARPAFDDAEGAEDAEGTTGAEKADARSASTQGGSTGQDASPKPADGSDASTEREAGPASESGAASDRRSGGEPEPDGDAPATNDAGGERGRTEDEG